MQHAYRHGDLVCATGLGERDAAEAQEMIENGTWVPPLSVEEREWDCVSWAERWRAYPSQDSWWCFLGLESALVGFVT